MTKNENNRAALSVADKSAPQRQTSPAQNMQILRIAESAEADFHALRGGYSPPL
ncbi:MAG: hypothetical protein LDL51_06660 [Chloroflexi bacterium]|nr:hypothetical protein [Chloroflexota bacterium]